MRKCIIVGAGEFSERSLPYESGDYLIAADGGYAYCEELGLVPDLVVGDFDSLKRIPSHPNRKVLPTEKDDTDMAVAVLEGEERGFTKYMIYGCLGGRFDHSMANLQLMAHMKTKGFQVELVGNEVCMTMLYGPEQYTFPSTCKGMISVFAFSDCCQGVCEQGLKYTINNYQLVNTKALGVSNEFMGIEAKVSLREGLLLLIYQRGDASV